MSLDLSKDQIAYVYLDAIKSLNVYNKIQDMLDLSLRLNKLSCLPGMIVDIILLHSSVSIMM